MGATDKPAGYLQYSKLILFPDYSLGTVREFNSSSTLEEQSFQNIYFHIKKLQKSRLPTYHQLVEHRVAVALLGWQGNWYVTVSLLMFHDFLSDHHHPHKFFASAAEFPGPGCKGILKCNSCCLYSGTIDSHSS